MAGQWSFALNGDGVLVPKLDDTCRRGCPNRGAVVGWGSGRSRRQKKVPIVGGARKGSVSCIRGTGETWLLNAVRNWHGHVDRGGLVSGTVVDCALNNRRRPGWCNFLAAVDLQGTRSCLLTPRELLLSMACCGG